MRSFSLRLVFAVFFALAVSFAGASATVAAAQGGAGAAPLRATAADAPRNLEVADFFRLRDVGDPQLSPDGEWVAYTVTAHDREKDSSETRIWMVATGQGGKAGAGGAGEALALTAAGSSARRPRWSPDGRYLAFLAARGDDETQVWALDRRGGEASPLTKVPQGVSSFVWSPEGKRLALVIQDPEPDKSADGAGEAGCDCAGGEGEKTEPAKTPPPWVIDRLQIKVDVDGYLNHRREHVYVLDLGADKPVQLTSGDYDDSQPAWSPDGRWIAFASNRGENPDATYDSDLWAVSAVLGGDAGAGRPLRRLTDHPGADDSPTWSPDGRWVAYLATPDGEKYFDYASRDLAVIPFDAAATAPPAPRSLAPGLDRVVYSPRFDPAGGGVYFLLEERGEQWLARAPLATGSSVERLVGGREVVQALDPGFVSTAAPERGARAVALLVSEPQLPSEVHLWAGGKLRRLSHTNDEVLAGLCLGEMESFDVASADGTVIQSFVLKPPGFDPATGVRVPAVLWIHGGPQGQYDWSFDFTPQLFAAAGYVVVLPNPRGSTGRGQAVCLAIWQGWGEKDFDDVMAALDWTIARGWTDPHRLGVGGWSYGGILTDHVITQTDRFAAAVTGASEVLYVANYGTDQYQRWWERELGRPWEPEARKIYERMSPFNHLDKVVTPTLILGGEKDWNVPVLNSEQLYQGLKSLGKVDTLLVVYPGEPHSISVPSYVEDRYTRYLDWFANYLMGKTK